MSAEDLELTSKSDSLTYSIQVFTLSCLVIVLLVLLIFHSCVDPAATTEAIYKCSNRHALFLTRLGVSICFTKFIDVYLQLMISYMSNTHANLHETRHWHAYFQWLVLRCMNNSTYL